MKNKIILLSLTGVMCLLAACSGDQTAQKGRDTGTNTYSVGKDTAKMDTSKATSADNSASGGAELEKDTSKKAALKK
ncbi:hypothetical protein HDF24_25810 [Mucilaginibacter sp. X4EP1]|uniref:hypothetical protein n=1 Tax=Mucilaginibacter sp. X4EP1 TaxID=2723092 RepID=UPI0021695817|nr:hypothetical protein [Mucilaginibacter sp. X4EP1]MCS3816369.1 hypothetical protein [Mucilaginibacter sp. X4EP1]